MGLFGGFAGIKRTMGPTALQGLTTIDYGVAAQAELAQKQQEMAREQWEWQKKQYERQWGAAQTGATGLTGLIGQYNKAYGEAKTANEQRYQQMLNIANQTTQQRAADIRSTYGQQGADIMQQLARQGMAGTTIAPTMQMGVGREREAALNRLADEMQGTKLGIMERRTDEYPKSDIIIALAQALGQSGGNVGNIVNALGQMRLG